MKVKYKPGGEIKIDFYPWKLKPSKIMQDILNEQASGRRLEEYALKDADEFVKVQFLPSLDREFEDLDKLKFTYRYELQDDKTAIKVFVDFENPEYVSMGDSFDQMMFDVKPETFNKLFLVTNNKDEVVMIDF